MKATATQKPEPFLRYGHTQAGQVTFNVQQTEQPDPEDTNERWEYDYVEVDNLKYETIVSAIVRDKYTEEQKNTILSNYLEGRGTEEFIELQKVREMAKRVALGQKHDVADYQPDIFQISSAKRLLQKVAEPILADEANLTEQDIEDAKMLYKQFKVGVTYDKDSVKTDEKRFVWNGSLYKVIGTKHTSQSDWTPDKAVSLYVKISPPGAILPYEQRPAENPYMKKDKVLFNGNTYESLVDTNTWSPTDYPAGWKLI
jgi:hypothetical protein